VNKLQVEIHKRFVNKASDWTIRKREAPIQFLRLFDWDNIAMLLAREHPV
jgi:hypothetical protein